ncbi:MAG TPA: UDP-N-acetylglucosamine 1-carboxyvinyltransferase [Candidatus Paceibacterota bacterium]
MATFTVQGGHKLEGVYEVSGAKNAGPKLIIATMLSDKPCTLRNIPRISDTEKILQAIREMGGECDWVAPSEVEGASHTVSVNCAGLNKSEVPAVVLTARHAVLFIGATLARLGEVRIAKVGGDNIGKRPVDRIIAGLVSLGAKHEEHDGYLHMTMPERPASRDYTFAKNTHTGTESLILGSIFNEGLVTIRNSAEEPEIDNLIQFVNTMGARVRRTDHRVIEVEGVSPLLGSATGESMYDRLEAATAITLAVMNGGDITVRNVDPLMVVAFTRELENMGVVFNWQGNSVSIQPSTEYLVPSTIKTAVHPGFMTDWQPIITLLLAYKANGRSEMHEMIYEQRWSALYELGKMGVKYELFSPPGYDSTDYNFNEREFNKGEPYGAYVWGPTKLQATELASRDVRAGITVLLAALFADGESKISDPDGHIDRGYEDIVGKLQKLGAKIERS